MPDYFYVYPAYLSEGVARREGRRVPALTSVKEVTIEEIAEAAKRLGFSAEIQAQKNYPRQFFTYAGRVKVTKKGNVTKTEFLRRVAAEVRRLRPKTTASSVGNNP